MAFLRRISDQGTYDAQIHLTNASTSFQEVLKIKSDRALKINQTTVYSSYMYHLKNNCFFVTMKEEQAKKFAYKPKSLAYALYRNVEFYSLILRLNHLRSVSEFTEELLVEGIIIPSTGIEDFLDEVLIKEKNPINRNLAQVLQDINSLT